MKDVWEVLGQKALELSRVEQEVKALRVAALLLSEEAAENDNQPTLQPAVNDAPQKARAV
jgi:hypothetical protein